MNAIMFKKADKKILFYIKDVKYRSRDEITGKGGIVNPNYTNVSILFTNHNLSVMTDPEALTISYDPAVLPDTWLTDTDKIDLYE
ncbi:hypothetical protein X275_08210 [Marinitoga sp. 1197]|uniref:hypothetical protein n=1 Tax=Marinitoga sp. 1197 TaxID=1428449 RepID=UPI00064182CD|nr:hypothetical protein [Marinitoga sp. 1197]KLO21865.1 hypothetical protein X275_08210 [Marinitoga sp. 1197]